jgi:protein-tyrosine phosphatase
MAAGLLRHRLAAAGIADPVTVASVGLMEGGVPASAHAVDVLATRGVDISDHRSQRMGLDDVERADLIIGMARHHVREAVLLDTNAMSRAFTLRDLVRTVESAPRDDGEPFDAWLARVFKDRDVRDLIGESADDDIADPIGRPPRVYEACAAAIDDLVVKLVAAAWPAAQRGGSGGLDAGEATP